MNKVGRPVGWRKVKSDMRPQHQVRAYPEEWQLIKKFADLVKHGEFEKCKKFISAFTG